MTQKSQTTGFYILLAIAGLVVLNIFWPFWELLAFSVILATLFHPLYKRIADDTHLPNLAAGFVVCIIAIILAGPVLLIGQQVFFELAGLYRGLNLQNFAGQSANFFQSLPQPLRQFAISLNIDFRSWLVQFGNQSLGWFSGLLSSLGWFLGSLVVAAFSIFFLLRDGEKIKQALSDLLPLSQANENILFNKLSRAVSGVVRGQFLVVLAISTAAFAGFWIFGLPNALLWACVMFVAAFVPTFGTSLVWLPAVIYLYFSGHTGEAVGLALWAWASVLLIDNILAAKLVSSRVRLHPLLTIFAILGGVVEFGVLGLLLGPVFAAIFMALLEIYRTEIRKPNSIQKQI